VCWRFCNKISEFIIRSSSAYAWPPSYVKMFIHQKKYS